MTTTSPESLALLGRAAELRASGTRWADAAAQLALGHDELRRLASDHGRDYERLLRRARTEVLRETLDEALAALRGFVKSPEPRVGMTAALTIVRYDVARMRHGAKDASERLQRDTRRQQTPPVNAEKPRSENVSESTKVPNQQEVNAAKKAAQSGPADAPASAARVPSQPAPTTPPTATPVAEKNKTSIADAIRRKRLLGVFAPGRTRSAPLTKGAPQTLEVDRLITGWLTQ